MSLWEYKVITSGKGGFARPDLMEKFLNDLGRDEWEIVQFHSHPDNFLAFTGLARRSTQRDWTLQDAAAAAAKVEAEKLRAEFEAKFKAAASSTPAGTEERAPSFIEEKAAPDDGFRKPVDTSRDDDPEAQDDEKADEWDKLTAAEEDELPTFFEAIKPHMRRNQRGPGMSVGVDYLAKKWDQNEDDLKGALVECGFVMPADEDSKAEYVEYDGDLYWLNINRRGELWINTKEKPRPVFRPVKAARIEVEAPPAREERRAPQHAVPPEERGERVENSEPAVYVPKSESAPEAAAPAPGAGAASSLPTGLALLDKIRPHMRRNRRGPGGSGSTQFLARALRTNEGELKAAFITLGLTIPGAPADKIVYSEFADEIWWVNLDSRGGLWINGREKKAGETAASATASEAAGESKPDEAGRGESAGATAQPAESAGSAEPPNGAENAGAAPVATPAASEPAAPATDQRASSGASASPLSAVRLLLKETKTGSVAAKTDRLAEELGKSPDDLIATLVAAGLKVPEKAREKPVFVPHGDEILWLNRNAKGELWLNAKASKFADKDGEGAEAASGEGAGEEKPRRGRSKKKETE